jgi:hypothetical protein
MADDGGADALACFAALRLSRHRSDELGLADRTHLFRTFGAVGPEALKKHGGNDVVAAVQVCQQFIEIVSAARPIP